MVATPSPVVAPSAQQVDVSNWTIGDALDYAEALRDQMVQEGIIYEVSITYYY